MNEHIELIVPARGALVSRILSVVLAAIAVLAGLLVFLTANVLILLIAIAFGVGAYFCSQRTSIEYEYSLTMSEMDVDIIFNKQSRKHLITLDLSKMEVCAPMGSYHLDEYKNRNCKTVDYSSGIPENDGAKYVMYYSGDTRYILEPDERLVNAFYNIAPRKVFKD